MLILLHKTMVNSRQDARQAIVFLATNTRAKSHSHVEVMRGIVGGGGKAGTEP